ncbi:glycoside hydrolase family 5 protein [Blautia coccoides]|uniref:Glycoside hydrolase family 5 protein n=1 Tax=Blautia hominis TaxID=2025493 RepID=A0ABQ0BKP5_9FIRM|nr:glycoside hydrolase family 5 protein [Blautia coccoides]MCQ4640902.1 glycoside hydrolase family 5 protein [Blautia coccoides]
MNKRLLSAFISTAVIAASIFLTQATTVKAETINFNSTAMEVANDMGAGWNLGNALDAYDSTGGNEQAWGNPIITEDFIATVKQAGFRTVRIPVTYMNHIGPAPEYQIDTNWLNRVNEVVNYVIDNDMYAVIDIHADANHDISNGAWLLVDSDNQTEIKAKFQKAWEQIADRFKTYDSRVIFESMNEIRENGNYSAPAYEETYSRINEYNQIFVDTIRSSGGQNDKRFLIVPGYNTNIDYTAGNYGFQLPMDTASNKLMVSVHYYDPYDFCLNEDNDAVYGWGQSAVDSNDGAVSWHVESNVQASMQLLQNKFTSKGIPVFVGEYGAADKSFAHAENEDYRRYFYEYVCKAIKDIGGVPCCWDNGWTGNYGFAIFNRTTNTVIHQDLVDAIMRATSGNNYSIQQP